MSKKSNGGSGNMLLLAGLGVGAFMLFANKGNAQSGASSADMPQGNGSDIPDTPKILAVNSSSTESPMPTGIVSDEEGMAPTNTQQSQSSGDDSDGGEDASSYGRNTGIRTVVNTGIDIIKKTQEYNEIPPLVSTKLTAKEKDIIDKGKLTAALAVKRPDLYKAAYIKRYGGKTQAGKRKALIAASQAIDTAVNAAQAAKTGGLVKAVKYPAKPEFTFVQAAGGMAAQVAMSQMDALQKAGVKVSPAAQKVSAQVKAAKGGKRHPAKATHAAKPAHAVAKKRIAHHTASPKATHAVAKKRATKKHR